MKTCKKCNSEFDGDRCKPCNAIRVAKYRADHPEHKIAANKCKAKRRLDNPEKNRIACAKYYAKNSIQMNLNAKEYYSKNSEKMNASSARWRSENVDRKKELDAKYRKENKEKIKLITANWRKENAIKCKENRIAWECKNPEKVKDSHAKWARENKEKVNKKSKRWRESNPERARECRLKSYEKNKEKRVAGAIAYRIKNPHIDRIVKHNRRARKLSVGGKLSKGLFDKLFTLQCGKCPVCKIALSNVKPRSPMDHIIALVNGGANEDHNIQILCQPCNNQKHTKDPIEFMQSRGFLI
jgi:5-methylcytosine-specific restriction endonuclease McrA